MLIAGRLFLIVMLACDWAAAQGLTAPLESSPGHGVWTPRNPVFPFSMRNRREIVEKIEASSVASLDPSPMSITSFASSLSLRFREEEIQSLPRTDPLYWFMSLQR